MPEAFLYSLHRQPRLDPERCGRVPQIVRARVKPGFARDAVEVARHGARITPRARVGYVEREQQPVFFLTQPEREPGARLLGLVLAQMRHGGRRQRHVPAPLGRLRFLGLKDDSVALDAHQFERAGNGQAGAVQVHVLPPERKQFIAPRAGDEFDAALLDQMTPELVLRLDMIASELLELGRTKEAVRALRGALGRVSGYPFDS